MESDEEYEMELGQNRENIVEKNIEYGNFECKICHSSFARNCYLLRHMRSHTVKKPFECEVCSQTELKKLIMN